MLVIGDIVRVTANQSYLGQLTQNVFFFIMTALPTPIDGQTDYQTLLQEFNAGWGITTRLYQSNSCTHTYYRIDNLTNGVDFAELPLNVAGSLTGPGAPSFMAINFILRRATGETRNGSKRMGGLTEDQFDANSVTLSGPIRSALEDAFGLSLLDSTTDDVTAIQIIVGRESYIDPEDGKKKYRLDLDRYTLVAGATLTAISTQRSRKLGRGV